MSRVRTALIGCVSAILVSVAMARVHPFGNAGLFTPQAATPIMENSSVPFQVRVILAAKCADCHSMQTRSPFYARFAPASWLMERDIVRAREAMNLSLWNTYSSEQQQTLASKIVHETREHEMPLLQYRMIHWNSRITGADLEAFANWAHASSGSAAGQSDLPAGAGDPLRGKAFFEKRCTGCHSLTDNHQGPRLQGVFGRASGSVASYAYSPALKNSHIVWDQTSLDKWLTDPDAFIPGNEMDFLVSKPQDRQDLIAFLKQTSGK